MLVFYPGDNTPVCTRQLNTYTTDIDAFEGVGAQVLAISPQSVESHDGLLLQAGRLRLPAARRRGQGGRARPTASSARSASTGGRPSSSTATGVVRYAHRALAGLTFRPTAELVAAVKAASTLARRLHLVGDAEQAGPGDGLHAAGQGPDRAPTQAMAPMTQLTAMPVYSAPVDWL